MNRIYIDDQCMCTIPSPRPRPSLSPPVHASRFPVPPWVLFLPFAPLRSPRNFLDLVHIVAFFFSFATLRITVLITHPAERKERSFRCNLYPVLAIARLIASRLVLRIARSVHLSRSFVRAALAAAGAAPHPQADEVERNPDALPAHRGVRRLDPAVRAVRVEQGGEELAPGRDEHAAVDFELGVVAAGPGERLAVVRVEVRGDRGGVRVLEEGADERVEALGGRHPGVDARPGALSLGEVGLFDLGVEREVGVRVRGVECEYLFAGRARGGFGLFWFCGGRSRGCGCGCGCGWDGGGGGGGGAR
ncbi:hypothetical protein OF83DRAFT_518327 [Amylostereum chailletii]|nr:hypothetical protein OF83DRAFT_518327 [Amylostereum chailletii]